MNQMQIIPAPVVAAFDNVPVTQRQTLLAVRDIIFDVARNDARIGPIEEALRWGEPSYLTTKNKTGSTIRLGIEKASGQPALFFNCKTTLVEEFRQQFGGTLTYAKNRAVILDEAIASQKTALKICIAAALTYHLKV